MAKQPSTRWSIFGVIVVLMVAVFSIALSVSDQGSFTQKLWGNWRTMGLEYFPVRIRHTGREFVREPIALRSREFRTEGNIIVDNLGNEIIFRGVNIPDPIWVSAQQYVLQPDDKFFDTIRAWGANIIRIPVHPGVWKAEGSQRSLQVLDRVVARAAEHGLSVIIDYHAIGWIPTGEFAITSKDWDLPYDLYRTSKEELRAFWDAVSKRYATNEAVVFYEIFNETVFPQWSVNGACEGISDEDWIMWRNIAEEITDVIRANDPDSMIIIGGLNWSYDLRFVASHPINRKNLVYGGHIYPNKTECGSWETMFGEVRMGYPIFFTEIGFGPGEPENEYPGPGQFRDDLKIYIDEHRMSWTAWAFSTEAWSTPNLLEDYQYSPSESGLFFRDWMQETALQD